MATPFVETRANRRLPGWIVFLVFVPLQIWMFIEIWQEWRWWTAPFALALGILGNRAARAPWLTQLLFPGRAYRHETRRHLFQGILFITAALAWLVPRTAAAPAWTLALPQPWLPLAVALTLVKAALR